MACQRSVPRTADLKSSMSQTGTTAARQPSRRRPMLTSRQSPGSGGRAKTVILAVCVALMGVALMGPSYGWAERPAAPQLLPRKTLAYVRVADSRELIDRFKQTAMGRLSQDEKIKPLVTQLYGSAAQAFTRAQDELGVALDQILAIPQGEVCVAVVSQAEGIPAVVAMLEAGDQLPVAEKLLDRVFQEAQNDGNVIRNQRHGSSQLKVIEGDMNNADGSHPAVCTRDGVILFATSSTVLKTILDVWDGDTETTTLADNRKFTSVMRRSTGSESERPHITFFIDPIDLFKNVSRDNFGAQAALAMLPALGLDGVRAAGGSIVFATEQFDSIAYLHLLLDSPREGVLQMLAIDSGDTSPEPWVPYDAASYQTIHWDAEQALDAFTKVYDKIRGQGALDRDLQQRFSDPLEIDFRAEILAQIAGRFSHVSWFEKPARINSGTNLIGVKVKDAAAFRKTMVHILTKSGAPATKRTHGKASYWEITPRRPRRENTNETLVRLPTPCLAVVGDYFLLSDSVACLQAAISNKEDPSKSLGDELDFKLIASRVRQQLGSTEPGMISFQRPEESMRSFYSLATSPNTRRQLDQAAQNNPVLRALNEALQQNPLPPFSQIAKYLAPGGGSLVSDDSGIHYTAFSLKRE